MNRILVLCCCVCFFAHGTDTQEELETIEVRAAKRIQNIHDVAIAVTAIGEQKIRTLNLQDSYQISGLSPNMLITENAGAGSPPAVTIRGVGLVDYNTSNTSPVAFYFDQAVNGSVNNQFADLFDMQSVEVLRGPQGTLFGRNTSGGAILFFSQKPKDSLAAYATAGIGSDQYRKLEGMINVPLASGHAMRLSGLHIEYDYNGANNLFDAPVARTERDSLRWQYAYNSDKLNVNLKLNASDWNGNTLPYGHTGVLDLNADGELCSPAKAKSGVCTDAFGFNDGSDDFRDVSVDNDSPSSTEQLGSVLALEWSLTPGLNLSSVTAYSDLERTHRIHCDASSLQICVGDFGLDNQVFSQELRLTGEFTGLNWIAGFFLFREDLAQDNSIDLLRDFRSLGPTSGAAKYLYDNSIETDSKALFAEINWNVSTDLQLTLGARFNDEEIRFSSDTDLNIPQDGNIDGITFPFWMVEDEIDHNQWSGRLVLSYQMTNTTKVYASANSGIKSGGFNGGYLFSAEEAEKAAYGPETLYAYEIGLKSSLWDKRARLALSGFIYDYRDQQVFINVQSVTPNAPNLQLLKNVASSDIAGVETEFEWQVSPALRVNISAGYIPRARFGNFTDPAGNIISGNRLPFTPEWQLSTAASYVYEFNHGDALTLTALARYQTEIYFDQNQSDYTQQGAYALLDLNMEYQPKESAWKAMLNVKNVLDEEYDTLRFDLIDFLGLVNSNKGEGRRVMLEVNYSFAD